MSETHPCIQSMPRTLSDRLEGIKQEDLESLALELKMERATAVPFAGNEMGSSVSSCLPAVPNCSPEWR